MQRLVAACAALLLSLAVVVWWQHDAELPDSSQLTSSGADASANFIADRQPLKEVEVASSEKPTATLIGVVDKTEALPVSAPHDNVGTNLRPGCLRKEDEKPDAAFELNFALRNKESSVGESSSLDKEACYAAVHEIKRARWMFDATPTQTVWYSAGRPWHGSSVQEIVLHELCSGDQPFDPTSAAKAELFFVTANETTKIQIGPYWVSDGTIQSPLTEEQYSHITKTLAGRRQDVIGPGGNMSAEIFDKRLKERYFNRITAEEEAQKQRDEERRRAQRGLPADCVE